MSKQSSKYPLAEQSSVSDAGPTTSTLGRKKDYKLIPLNYHAYTCSIGDQEVIYQPLVVGGGDAEGTYRADSFICSAAVHRGLFTVGRAFPLSQILA